MWWRQEGRSGKPHEGMTWATERQPQARSGEANLALEENVSRDGRGRLEDQVLGTRARRGPPGTSAFRGRGATPGPRRERPEEWTEQFSGEWRPGVRLKARRVVWTRARDRYTRAWFAGAETRLLIRGGATSGVPLPWTTSCLLSVGYQQWPVPCCRVSAVARRLAVRGCRADRFLRGQRCTLLVDVPARGTQPLMCHRAPRPA